MSKLSSRSEPKKNKPQLKGRHKGSTKAQAAYRRFITENLDESKNKVQDARELKEKWNALSKDERERFNMSSDSDQESFDSKDEQAEENV